MPLTSLEQEVHNLEIIKTEDIAAPIDVVFETILEQLGPLSENPDGTPMAMRLEAWPGGRWYRDLGNNSGHFWGHVQAIKPPALLEICGPLFMSFPVTSNVQYRLSEENGMTQIRFVHRAMGLLPPELRDSTAVNRGWSSLFGKIRERAERKAADRGKKGK